MSGAPESRSPLVAEVLKGGNPELQLLAARGVLPLSTDEIIPLQVALAEGEDEEIARQARASLEAADPRITAGFLSSHATLDELSFFGRSSQHPVIQEAVLRRRDVPTALLEELAERLSSDLQEVLLLRQDAIVEHPAILESLERNTRLTPYARRRIAEYREHLVPREEAAPEEVVLPEIPQPEVTDEELAAAIASVKGLPQEGELDDLTGLSESQVRQLPLPIRLRLSRGASRGLRQILVRDTNSLVALSVIANNPLSDQEVEQIARNRSVCEEVLVAIGRRREFMRKYPIVLALVANPRTPIANAMKMIPMLSVRDLRNLAKDKNISEVVRRGANRLYKIKQI